MDMALKLLIPLELHRSENAFGSLELLSAQTRKDASKVVLAERALASLERQAGLTQVDLLAGTGKHLRAEMSAKAALAAST